MYRGVTQANFFFLFFPSGNSSVLFDRRSRFSLLDLFCDVNGVLSEYVFHFFYFSNDASKGCFILRFSW